MYRLVLLDSSGNEIGDVTDLQMKPESVLVAMPQPSGMFSQAQCAAIGTALDQYGLKGIVFSVPVAFARLERTES